MWGNPKEFLLSKKLGAYLGVLALAGGVALVGVGPALATGNHGRCPVTTVRDLSAVTVSGGGEAALTGHGLWMKTPEKPSRVRWQSGVSGPFSSLTGLSYRTRTASDGDRGSATVAARVGLDTDANGTADVTLVYEPYWNGTVVEGPEQAWDAIDGGAGLWWWAEEPGNPQTTRPWSKYQELHPIAALVHINLGMGTWNEGAKATVDDLRVTVKGAGCTRVQWKKPPPVATPTPTASASASPTPTPTATPTATATPTVTVSASPSSTTPVPVPSVTASIPVDPVGNEGDLPTTGADVLVLFAVGGLIVAAGAGAVVAARRRRTRFTT